MPLYFFSSHWFILIASLTTTTEAPTDSLSDEVTMTGYWKPANEFKICSAQFTTFYLLCFTFAGIPKTTTNEIFGRIQNSANVCNSSYS